jgi:hypothetical protein
MESIGFAGFFNRFLVFWSAGLERAVKIMTKSQTVQLLITQTLGNGTY